MPEVSNRKKSQVMAYRRKKDLCTECGGYEPTMAHTCNVNYVKADTRGIGISNDDIFEVKEVTFDIPDEPVVLEEDPAEDITDDWVETPERALPELDVRIKTILSYRKRKELCAYCGKCQHTGQCEEDYTASDLRSDEEKREDPRTVVTPKSKESTVLEEMETEVVNDDFLKRINDPFYQLDKTVDIHTTRPFIIIDITPSDTDQRMTFDYINYVARRHKNLIIYLVGNPSKVFTFFENRTLDGLYNVSLLRNTIDQNIVNHLHAAKRFFGFPSRYVTYCMTRNLECTTFLDNSNDEFDLPCDIVSIKDDENVTIEIVKRNVLSWRL